MRRRTVLLVGLLAACVTAGLVAASLATHSARALRRFVALWRRRRKPLDTE